MTHFNHDWDTTVTPAIPVATGDRYYAQDLNDDFNYLQNLLSEMIYRHNGTVKLPTVERSEGYLSFSGGRAVFKKNTQVLDDNEPFVVPPKTKAQQIFEIVDLTDTTLAIPQDNTDYYIVAVPQKQSLLTRIKAILTGGYASRIKYTAIPSLVPCTGDYTLSGMDAGGYIILGAVRNSEYMLFRNPTNFEDKSFDYEEFIKIPVWNGDLGIHSELLQSATGSSSIKGCSVTVQGASDGSAISSGEFYNCNMSVTYLYRGFTGGHFHNCKIAISGSGDDAERAFIFNSVDYNQNPVNPESPDFDGCDINLTLTTIPKYMTYGGRDDSWVSGGYMSAGIVNTYLINCKITCSMLYKDQDKTGEYGTGAIGLVFAYLNVFINCKIEVSGESAPEITPHNYVSFATMFVANRIVKSIVRAVAGLDITISGGRSDTSELNDMFGVYPRTFYEDTDKSYPDVYTWTFNYFESSSVYLEKTVGRPISQEVSQIDRYIILGASFSNCSIEEKSDFYMWHSRLRFTNCTYHVLFVGTESSNAPIDSNIEFRQSYAVIDVSQVTITNSSTHIIGTARYSGSTITICKKSSQTAPTKWISHNTSSDSGACVLSHFRFNSATMTTSQIAVGAGKYSVCDRNTTIN